MDELTAGWAGLPALEPAARRATGSEVLSLDEGTACSRLPVCAFGLAGAWDFAGAGLFEGAFGR
ncbi:MAG: hypothetical protein ACXWM8_08965, partial [Candidatus Limnocylindrales bacterium]